MKITLNIEKNEIESLVKDYVKKTLNIDGNNLVVTITDNTITVVSDTVPKKKEEKVEEVKAETKKENKPTDSISALLNNAPTSLFN